MTPRNNYFELVVDDSSNNRGGMIVDDPTKMKNKRSSRPSYRPPRDSPKSVMSGEGSVYSEGGRNRSSSLRRMVRPSGSWSAGSSSADKTEKSKFPGIVRSNSFSRILPKGSKHINKKKQDSSSCSSPPTLPVSALKKPGKITQTKVLPQQESDEIQMEDDPVMALFETRNTNRVRFSVDNDEPNKGKSGAGRPASPPLGGDAKPFNIKSFMKKALFAGGKKSGDKNSADIDAEVLEIEKAAVGESSNGSQKQQRIPFVWISSETTDSSTPGVLHTVNQEKDSNLTVTFTENPKTQSDVAKLLSRGARAQNRHFQYAYAVKCIVRALEKMKKAKKKEIKNREKKKNKERKKKKKFF